MPQASAAGYKHFTNHTNRWKKPFSNINFIRQLTSSRLPNITDTLKVGLFSIPSSFLLNQEKNRRLIVICKSASLIHGGSKAQYNRLFIGAINRLMFLSCNTWTQGNQRSRFSYKHFEVVSLLLIQELWLLFTCCVLHDSIIKLRDCASQFDQQ